MKISGAIKKGDTVRPIGKHKFLESKNYVVESLVANDTMVRFHLGGPLYYSTDIDKVEKVI